MSLTHVARVTRCLSRFPLSTFTFYGTSHW